VPLLTPRLSSLWIGLVTPVDAGVARPLIEGLSTKTTMTDDSGAKLFDITPLAFDEALQRAVADDNATGSTRGTARRRVNVLDRGGAPSHDARRRPRGCAAEVAEAGRPADGGT
jgi:hypothetical protein